MFPTSVQNPNKAVLTVDSVTKEVSLKKENF